MLKWCRDHFFCLLSVLLAYSAVCLNLVDGFVQQEATTDNPVRPPHPSLGYYELLHKSVFRYNIVSRESQLKLPWKRHIHFYCFGRSFNLHLEPRLDLLSPNLTVYLVDGRGHHHQHYPHDINRYYHGYLMGDNSSSVVASLSSDNGDIVSASIYIHNDTYYIEPAHLHIGESYDSHVIMYRKSDSLKRNATAESVDYITAPDPYNTEEPVPTLVHKREQRTVDAAIKDTCSIVVVADYRFFSFLRSSKSNVIDTMVSRIDAADRLSFRPAEWIINANGDTITGQGLQIQSIVIHTEPSSDPSHYNSIEGDDDLTIHRLLQKFSRSNWSGYCLAHLMTHRSFPSNKLGLAYIASPEADETGGICSSRVVDAATHDVVTYNTGVSIVSSGGRLLLPSEAELVISHEIGHSWGSSHDPGNNLNCASNYLMNEFIQDDSNPKHRRFSSCSLASIGRVLLNKATCFESKFTSLCGNFKVDKGEECDEGSLGETVADDQQQSCCTSDCFLREGNRCSDVNHPCCLGCQIAPEGSKVCHVVGNISLDCTTSTTCDGLSENCPKPNQAEVDSLCIDGVCMYRNDDVSDNATLECVPYCDIAGLRSCTCTGDNQCLECCLNDDDDVCEPLIYKGDTVTFPDGVFCSGGYCGNGVCLDSGQDFASQLWSVISTLDINEYAQFVQQNIVGFVLSIVTIFWVPGSCLFYCLCDKMQIWKRCLKGASKESPDIGAGSSTRSGGGPTFESQTSWVKGKPEQTIPLLSVEDYDDIVAIEEPVDDQPLPAGFSNYSNDSISTKESIM